ncbi:hypothetical protein FB451DRAFT_1170470 [Mycena latifolia]|nr:hypothetical protein FB451DRAFT_1170470 [Mycena latifolia]
MPGGDLCIQILNVQAEVHLLKSEYVEAQIIHTQILHNPLIEQHSDPYRHALSLVTMAQIDVEVGASRDKVHRNIDTAKQLFSHAGSSIGPILCDITTAALYLNEVDLLKAKSLFQTCLRSMWGKYTEIVSYCLERLANASLWVSMDLASSNWTVTFLVHSLKSKQKLEIHKALQFLGDLYLADRDRQTAISLFTVALDGFTKMDVHRSRGECMLRLGDIAEVNEDLPKAAELWKIVRPLFERSSQAKQATHIDERLARVNIQLDRDPGLSSRLSALNAPIIHPETNVAGADYIQPALIPAA